MSSSTQSFAIAEPRHSSLLRDHAELFKARVTTLILLTVWSGGYFAAGKSGVPALGRPLFDGLVGVGLVAAGTAAMNEVIERDSDARMLRTRLRPLVTGSLSLNHALLVSILTLVGGSIYLAISTNWLTAVLTACTSLVYLAAYTPMKKVHPICTTIGAIPGAMPPVLGWTAIRGRVEWECLALFALMFVWQFPHFHSIAWIYQEDYKSAGIRMLPVVQPDGRSTANSILIHAVLLVPVSLTPLLLGMSGDLYYVSAIVLDGAFLYVCWRIRSINLRPAVRNSKPYARQVLLSSVLYLPILFGIMMANRP